MKIIKNKREKVVFILALFVIALAFEVSTGAIDMPASSLKISMDESIESALGSMEDIKAREVQAEKTYHKYRETQALRYPDLVGHGEWTNNARYPVNQRYPAGGISDYELGIGAVLRQVVWSFGRISSAVEAAEKSLEISKLDVQVKKADVIYRAKVSYFTLIFAQRGLDIVLESYQNSLDNKKILQDRSVMGRVSRKDNIKIEADIAARVPLVTNVKADIISAENTLKRIMGLDFDTEIEITDTFEENYSEKEYDELVRYLWEKEPTLKMLEENISLQNTLIKGEMSEYLPNISAFATWDYMGRSDQAKDWYVGKERLMDHFGTIGLQLEIPIFDCGRVSEKIKQAQKEKEKAVLEFEKVSRDLALELKNAVSDYNEYVKTLQANIKSVNLSEKSFKLFQDFFRTGQVTLLELNDAELSLANQKLARDTTLFNLNVTLARIERLIAEGVDT
ncbi:MAG: TolC family protein [Candidatus Omnitrophota bacterium]